jgi:hypothetical protein
VQNSVLVQNNETLVQNNAKPSVSSSNSSQTPPKSVGYTCLWPAFYPTCLRRSVAACGCLLLWLETILLSLSILFYGAETHWSVVVSITIYIWFCEMDGLSVAASIIAVLQLTGTVIGYLNDVKNAPKECQQCTIEASNLQTLLVNLRYRLEQGQAGRPWFTAVGALTVENGPLDQYKLALVQLQSKVETQDGIQKVKRRLLWTFKKEEVASILARMERLKSLVSMALEMDHMQVLTR